MIKRILLLTFIFIAACLAINALTLPTQFIPKLIHSANILETPLDKVVKTALVGSEGDYGIVIKSLKTGEIFTQNEHKSFEPGSLYKLWVMGTAYTQMEAGTLKKDQVLSATIEHLNRTFDIDPEYAELTEGGIEMTVTQAINQMITISHNYAALLLAERVKNTNINKFLEEYDMNESNTGTPPKSSAFDTAKFYEKLYKGEIVNPQASQEMMGVLKKQQLNDGLPKFLPEGVEVAHKTGDLGWFKHDGGIVFSPKGDYLIVVLSESNSPTGAQARIASLSKAVWDYFNN